LPVVRLLQALWQRIAELRETGLGGARGIRQALTLRNAKALAKKASELAELRR
jgi:hypothetical protein